MKILLDTTYLLPIIGIAIKEIPKDTLLKLKSNGHDIAVSETTVFELSAKGAKFVQNNELLPERVTVGIRSILSDDSIRKISSYDSKILLTAFSLRGLMADFIDCLILSAALNCCDVLVTEDQVIHGLKRQENYCKIQAATNPMFRIETAKQIQDT